jgi:hypothetical protein
MSIAAAEPLELLRAASPRAHASAPAATATTKDARSARQFTSHPVLNGIPSIIVIQLLPRRMYWAVVAVVYLVADQVQKNGCEV